MNVYPSEVADDARGFRGVFSGGRGDASRPGEVNPDSLIAEEGRFTKYLGKNASFERPEKLVILLDKYDAALPGEGIARTTKPPRYSARSSRKTTDAAVIIGFWSSLRTWMRS